MTERAIVMSTALAHELGFVEQLEEIVAISEDAQIVRVEETAWPWLLETLARRRLGVLETSVVVGHLPLWAVAPVGQRVVGGQRWRKAVGQQPAGTPRRCPPSPPI
jgi:hypothetical protein